jgi:hypothetical protein
MAIKYEDIEQIMEAAERDARAMDYRYTGKWWDVCPHCQQQIQVTLNLDFRIHGPVKKRCAGSGKRSSLNRRG